MQLPKKGKTISLKEVKKLCVYFNLIDLLDKIENDPPIKPFKSDGCSCWPNVWKNKSGKKVSIYECCLKHDLQYWGNYPNDKIVRLIADAKLMIDVALKTKRVNLATLMFLGVRFGGGSFWKRAFSFGFGRVY